VHRIPKGCSEDGSSTRDPLTTLLLVLVVVVAAPVWLPVGLKVVAPKHSGLRPEARGKIPKATQRISIGARFVGGAMTIWHILKVERVSRVCNDGRTRHQPGVLRIGVLNKLRDRHRCHNLNRRGGPQKRLHSFHIRQNALPLLSNLAERFRWRCREALEHNLARHAQQDNGVAPVVNKP
jgi:hypothetical protein